MSRRLNEAEYNKELVERFVCPNFNHEAKFDDSLVLSIKVYRGCETFDSRAEAEALARKIADKFRKDFD
ncbi:hypothetical protein IKQ65_01875 [Candidatus Saccharibacteria bacterium]|nr:hypothetical protein [Candidatus Saccharibacteria bacterium]